MATNMIEEVEDLVQRWLAEQSRNGDIEFYRKKADSAAALLVSQRTVYLAMEPGNSTHYDLVLTRLEATPSKQLGGDLLVSLANFNVCFVLDSTGVHYPWYLQGKVPSLGDSDVIVLASILTLVSVYLGHLADQS